MVEIAKGLRSYRALLTGFAVFYLLSLWFIAQQYHVPLLAKVRGASKVVGPKPQRFDDVVRNATLGVRILSRRRQDAIRILLTLHHA